MKNSLTLLFAVSLLGSAAPFHSAPSPRDATRWFSWPMAIGNTAPYAAYGSLSYDKTIPEAIVVGLDYAGDNLDYFSMRDDDLLPMTPLPSAGTLEHTGAEAFLRLIESQAIPLLERDYRADPHYRVLMGVSDGGAFALYALFKDPDLFKAYIAASPS